jgi:hypothetical protein
MICYSSSVRSGSSSGTISIICRRRIPDQLLLKHHRIVLQEQQHSPSSNTQLPAVIKGLPQQRV